MKRYSNLNNRKCLKANFIHMCVLNKNTDVKNNCNNHSLCSCLIRQFATRWGTCAHDNMTSVLLRASSDTTWHETTMASMETIWKSPLVKQDEPRTQLCFHSVPKSHYLNGLFTECSYKLQVMCMSMGHLPYPNYQIIFVWTKVHRP